MLRLPVLFLVGGVSRSARAIQANAVFILFLFCGKGGKGEGESGGWGGGEEKGEEDAGEGSSLFPGGGAFRRRMIRGIGIANGRCADALMDVIIRRTL